MVKADKNKQYSFALIAIVAIVAIVGIVMMFMNANPKLGIDLSTGASSEQESLLGEAAAKPLACTDSDGGRKYYTPGYVLYGGKTYNDACSGPNIINEKYCTAKLTQGNTQYTCPNGCKNRACIIKTTPGDLSVYPNQFLTPDKLALDVKIVVGSTAPTSHVMGAIDIAAGIQRAMGDRTLNPMPVGIAVLDVDITNPLSVNIISIGMPCVNRVSAELMGNPAICTEGFTAGQGRIISFNNNGKTQILVAGYTDTDNLATAYVLGSYDKYLLKGSECQVIVYDINTLTVNCPPVTNPNCDFATNLMVGETKTFTLEGMDYEVSNVFVDPSHKSAMITVNGVITKELAEGESQVLNEGMKVTVNKVNSLGADVCLKKTTLPPDPVVKCEGMHGIQDTMRSKETKTYTIDGKDYEVSFISFEPVNRTVQFSINGVLTKYLTEGKSQALGYDLMIKILNIMISPTDSLTEFCLSQRTYSEADDCVFASPANPNQSNYCYSSKGNCSGYNYCGVNVTGTYGEQLTWSSNCLGNPESVESVIDGYYEELYFNCSVQS